MRCSERRHQLLLQSARLVAAVAELGSSCLNTPESAKNNHADHLDVFRDHSECISEIIPPHFHVEFQGEKATFSFDGRLRPEIFRRDGSETICHKLLEPVI
jgi:hypothetical protein